CVSRLPPLALRLDHWTSCDPPRFRPARPSGCTELDTASKSPMNPIVFALRHPVTVVVALVGVLVGSVLALARMKIDIFPNLNLPVIYVVQPYGGMDPAQMEGLLTFHYENHFLYISGIHHVESRNIQGFAQMKIFFHPGTNMTQAMA